MTRSRRWTDTEDSPNIVPNAPPILVDDYDRMKIASQNAQQGPSLSQSLLERLLTHQDMSVVWQRLGCAIRKNSEEEQHVAFRAVLSAIQYAWWTYKKPVVPRRTLQKAINRLGLGLKSLGKVMVQDRPLASESASNAGGNTKKRWKAVPSWLLYECFPDDLAGVLEHYGPHMEIVASQANQKARTVLARTRPVDRSGYGWSVFVRILRMKWPQLLLKGQDTDDTLARIARAVLPDCDVTAPQVRDTLRRTSVRR